MLKEWPDLLYHACVHKDTQLFQLLVDWLFAQSIADHDSLQLIENSMTKIVDINKHQYLRILLEKCKNYPCFDACAKPVLWYAFTHQKYDSVDTLLEYISPTPQSQQVSLLSEREYRCKQVIDIVFTDGSVRADALSEMPLLCAKDQQCYLKMILENICRFSYFNEWATHMLKCALEQKSYEGASMVLAYRDHLKSNTIITFIPWWNFVEQLSKDKKARLFANMLEWLFWPVAYKIPRILWCLRSSIFTSCLQGLVPKL